MEKYPADYEERKLEEDADEAANPVLPRVQAAAAPPTGAAAWPVVVVNGFADTTRVCPCVVGAPPVIAACDKTTPVTVTARCVSLG